MSNLIKTKLQAREALLNGINTVSDIVRSTYGPNGKQVAISKMGQHLVTNDGVTVAQNVKVDDRFEQLGIDIFVDIAKNTDKDAGDGRTTSIILGQALANSLQGGGMRDYKNLLNEKDKVVKELKKMSEKVEDIETIKKVATLSSESEKVGDIIAKAFEKVGTDGLVKSEESSGTTLELEIAKGFEIPAGYKIVHMITDLEKMVAEAKESRVLVADYDISNVKQLLPIMEKVAAKGDTGMTLFAKSISNEVANIIAVNKLKGTFSLQFVEVGKVPKYEEYLADLAVLTGSRLLDKVSLLEEVELEDLGKAQSIEIYEDKTVVVNDRNITKEVTLLRGQDNTEDRVARLTNGLAIIKVGATTETERKYLAKKVTDAVNATKASIEEGIVKGAGEAYVQVADKLKLPLLDKILRTPRKQLEENNTEFIEEVIDPTKVQRVALESACSVMGVLLTTDTLLLDEVKES